MNKEQAIKIRSCFANGVEFKELYTEEIIELADELNNALEKQIAKKPIFEINCVQIDGVTPGGCPVCPTCHEPTYSANICYFCGQHLEQS